MKLRSEKNESVHLPDGRALQRSWVLLNRVERSSDQCISTVFSLSLPFWTLIILNLKDNFSIVLFQKKWNFV